MAAEIASVLEAVGRRLARAAASRRRPGRPPTCSRCSAARPATSVSSPTGLNELASALVASIQLARRARSRPAPRDRGVHRADDPVSRRSGQRAARSDRRARHRRRRARPLRDARGAPRQPRRRELRGQRPGALSRQHVEAVAGEQPGAPAADACTRCATTGSRCTGWRVSSRAFTPSACFTRTATSRAPRSTRAASRERPATSSSRCATCARSCTRSRSSRRSPRRPAATCRSTTSWAG